MTDRLTARQAEVLRFVASRVNQAMPPTQQEIGEHFGIQRSAIRRHLEALERKGYIRLMKEQARGIALASNRGQA